MLSEKKMNKKNFKVKSDDYGGETLGQALKFLDALAMYDKYRAEGSDATPAMKRVLRLKRFDWSLGSLKRNLSKARRLPSDLGAVQAKRAKIALKGK